MKKFISLFFLFAQLSWAGSIVKIVDLPPEMIELNQLIQDMCQNKFGDDYLRPNYPPRFTLLMIDYSNDLKYVFSEENKSYLQSDDAFHALENIIENALSGVSHPLQMNQQLAEGDLTYFQVTQMPSQQRKEFGAPKDGPFYVLAFEAKPVPELTQLVTQIRTELQTRQLVLHQTDGKKMPAYSPFRLVFTSCLVNRSLEESERLTLTQLAQESGEGSVQKLTEIQFKLRQESYPAGRVILEVPGQAHLTRDFGGI